MTLESREIGMEDRSPLDILAREIERNELEREDLERQLDSLPRWRFRRRSETRRRLERRLVRKSAFEELTAPETRQLADRPR
jgi:hypothetical protein